MEVILHVTILFVLYIFMFTSGDYSPCFKRKIKSAPSYHLMNTKPKPLVIGHRGNPRKYQENTLDGFKSLLNTKADGFELDIYLTKDEQLVVFHDDNTKQKTGVNKLVWESTAKELTQLKVKSLLNYGKNVFNYSKPRPIPLLKDVLDAMKHSDKLMYLEMKPVRIRNLKESFKVGKAVAKMVTEMKLEKSVVINSFDPLKTLAAYQENPNIPTGFFYHSIYWSPKTYQALHYTTLQIPGFKDCINRAPNGTEFIKVMFTYGDILKSINASFVEIDYKIFNNIAFSTKTFQSLHKYYSPNISIGAFTLYDMEMSEKQFFDQDTLINSLIKLGLERVITDDIDRMLHTLNRLPTAQTPQPTTSTATKKKLFLVSQLFVMIVSWFHI